MRTRDRVRTASAAVPVTEIVTDIPHWPCTAADEVLFGQVDSHDDSDLDLVDLLLWAERTGIVDARDLSMLVEYYYAREFTGAGHDHVAQRFGVTARTSKRRCAAAVTALQTAAAQVPGRIACRLALVRGPRGEWPARKLLAGRCHFSGSVPHVPGDHHQQRAKEFSDE